MTKRTRVLLTAILLAITGLYFAVGVIERDRGIATEPAASPAQRAGAGEPASSARDVGFTSHRALEEHYAKHGREFGSITRDEYLRRARALRDADVGGPIREARRGDGVITRFDAESGGFIAFHADGTIRTYFKPSDGARYFERQLEQRRD